MENNIEIDIKLEDNNIIISSENKNITINQNEKEIKGSKILQFIQYSVGNKYKLKNLKEEYADNEFVKSVYDIFEEICRKLNNIEEFTNTENENNIYSDELPF